MSGSDIAQASGIYGTLGTEAASNVPGARTSAVSWTDASGNLWLFGGLDSNYQVRNDLWRYNISSGMWTWMGGSDTPFAAGVYGTQGTADASNVPGARWGAASWNDASGNLWLFGGEGTLGSFNDLWMYNPSTNQWTWMGGSDTTGASGVYGTQGTAAASNVIGGRRDTVSWTDASGNIWLLGGYGADSTGTPGYLNDLWMYSISTKQWTWMSGSNTVNAKGVYGSLGTAAASNVPGARQGAVSWSDASGNLWLFGGYGWDASTSGTTGTSYLNDLWKYSPSSGQWTWVGGSNTVDATGVYGTLGTAAASNFPGARFGAVRWTDASGNIWLFGGEGLGQFAAYSELSDLWKYSPTSGQWTWMSGGWDINGIYGTQGTASPDNIPGSRNGAVGWTDSSGKLWLFGGAGFDSAGANSFLNDLWSYH